MAKALPKKKSDKKRYRVSGVTELLIDGQTLQPGDEFDGQLDVDFEMQMLAGGHLEVLADQSAAADRAELIAENAPDSPAAKTPKTKRAE